MNKNSESCRNESESNHCKFSENSDAKTQINTNALNNMINFSGKVNNIGGEFNCLLSINNFLNSLSSISLSTFPYQSSYHNLQNEICRAFIPSFNVNFRMMKMDMILQDLYIRQNYELYLRSISETNLEMKLLNQAYSNEFQKLINVTKRIEQGASEEKEKIDMAELKSIKNRNIFINSMGQECSTRKILDSVAKNINNGENKNKPSTSGFTQLINTNLNNSIKIKNEMLSKRRSRKVLKQVTNCVHIEAKHYAKNMCNNCYHSKGRNKRAWACSHNDKPLYALGVCQSCYQLGYSKVRNFNFKQILFLKQKKTDNNFNLQEDVNELELDKDE